uniref:Uncharacterized protein n=1 Tax=Prymnesium polylepis TaxID=72548 RepID=A0A7S4K8H6_9EUKA
MERKQQTHEERRLLAAVQEYDGRGRFISACVSLLYACCAGGALAAPTHPTRTHAPYHARPAYEAMVYTCIELGKPTACWQFCTALQPVSRMLDDDLHLYLMNNAMPVCASRLGLAQADQTAMG